VALYAETLLEREPHLSERGRHYLGTISRAIDDVAATVARMREFYRQRTEPQVMGPVALNTLVQQVVDLTHARWSDIPQQRGIVIQLQTELADDLPLVLGVDSELREALINLVLNAVDAMPDGGALALRTRSALMLDAADQETQRICVDVVDSGVGMGPNTRLHCLEPFFTTKGERGTGLGLAMVYGVMQRHHGDVEIDSELGIGTTVSLSFPRPPPGTHAVVPTAEALGPLPHLNILLVDDDPLMLKSLGDTLELDGHFVVTANGGQRGIDTFREHLRNQPFDLVITDLGMPYVDGRRVAGSIKGLSNGTPVVMLTGWGERMLATGDVPAQVDLLLGKPIRPHDLRAALGLLMRPPTGAELSKETT
jgi:CheY-like chemotaxis protein